MGLERGWGGGGGGGTPAQTETNLKLEIVHILPQSDPEYDANGVRKPTTCRVTPGQLIPWPGVAGS